MSIKVDVQNDTSFEDGLRLMVEGDRFAFEKVCRSGIEVDESIRSCLICDGGEALTGDIERIEIEDMITPTSELAERTMLQ